jgi:hypothetical protein
MKGLYWNEEEVLYDGLLADGPEQVDYTENVFSTEQETDTFVRSIPRFKNWIFHVG